MTTASGVAMASGMAGNIYYAVGQPFASQWEDGHIEISEGVAQAQIYNILLLADTCEGEDYIKHGYYYPADTAPGIYNERKYIHSTTIGYDTISDLQLTIHPTYDIYDTVRLYNYYSSIIPWQEGNNFISGQTKFGCDSNRHICVILRPFECGDTIVDNENNKYSTIEIGGICWTKENIRSTIYSDSTPIPTGYIYNSPTAQDTIENLNTYGRLYTWQSAVGVPENSTEPPPTRTAMSAVFERLTINKRLTMLFNTIKSSESSPFAL